MRACSCAQHASLRFIESSAATAANLLCLRVMDPCIQIIVWLQVASGEKGKGGGGAAAAARGAR